MKKCSRCKQEKESISFYKDKRSSDGLNCACKICVNLVNKEWANRHPDVMIKISKNAHEKNREKEREYARQYATKLRKENYAKYKENKIKWEKENPEKHKEINKKARKKHANKNYDIFYEKNIIWRKNNPEKIKIYGSKSAKIMRIKYPEKNAARKMVYGAIVLGILTRPQVCSQCLIECKPEGHHSDYSKPLEVIWLCKKCHIAEHKKCKAVLHLE